MKLNFQPRYFIPAILAGVTLLSLVVIGFEVGWGSRVSLPQPHVKRQDSKLAMAPLMTEFALPPVDPTYNAVLERPLFVPTRRPPPPPPPVEPPKPAMKKGQFLLMGVIITKDKKIGMLREVANGKVTRVEEGQLINGIKLEKLEAERVTLTQWGDREELILKIQAAPRVAQAPVPGAPPLPGTPALPGEPPRPVVNPVVPAAAPGVGAVTNTQPTGANQPITISRSPAANLPPPATMEEFIRRRAAR